MQILDFGKLLYHKNLLCLPLLLLHLAGTASIDFALASPLHQYIFSMDDVQKHRPSIVKHWNKQV